MARLNLQLLLLILSVLYIAVMVVESNAKTNFIESSCSGTPYPAVCVRTLSRQASMVQQSLYKLAEVALTVSLATAESTKANMVNLTNLMGLKPTECRALNDSLGLVQETVDQLCQSVREMGELGHAQGESFLWYERNVESWISTTLTQITICGSGLSRQALDEKIKASMQGQITNVEQLVSIAQALFQQFVAKH